MTVADTPDWSSPGGGPPAQRIGQPIGTTGQVALGSDGTDAQVILVDTAGRIICVGAGGYLSLTGAGRTATPGDLTQLGSFKVIMADGSQIQLFDETAGASAGIAIEVRGTSTGSIEITTAVHSSGGIHLQDLSPGGIDIDAQGSGGIVVQDPGGGGVQITSATQVAVGGLTVIIEGDTNQMIGPNAINGGTSITDDVGLGTPFVAGEGVIAAGTIRIGTATSDHVGFFGHVPVARPAHPVTLTDVINVLSGLGLTA